MAEMTVGTIGSAFEIVSSINDLRGMELKSCQVYVDCRRKQKEAVESSSQPLQLVRPSVVARQKTTASIQENGGTVPGEAVEDKGRLNSTEPKWNTQRPNLKMLHERFRSRSYHRIPPIAIIPYIKQGALSTDRMEVCGEVREALLVAEVHRRAFQHVDLNFLRNFV